VSVPLAQILKAVVICHWMLLCIIMPSIHLGHFMDLQRSHPPIDHPVSYTFSGVIRGMRVSLPLAISVAAYGVVFGVLARQAGLSLGEATLMSSLVVAGASQFLALELWLSPLPIVAIVLTTLVVNLRHLLMGAALRPWFAQLPPLSAYGSLFFMGDESWALTMRELIDGRTDAAFLVGSGATLNTAWIGSTIAGHLLGALVGDPTQWGLDFAFTAVFLALLVGLWQGKSDWLPWVVAAIVAVIAAQVLPGKWYILLGGLAGSLAGALRDAT
jgi:4-azaleucine resistance transporter AzlC